MVTVQTPSSNTDDALPVGRLDASGGVRVAALPGSSSASPALSGRVYVISATVPVYISIGPGAEAGDQAGSLLLGPGALVPFLLSAGDRIAARAVDQAGAVLAVPLSQE